jgi:hypothetical protein
MVDRSTGKFAANYDNTNLNQVKQYAWTCNKERPNELIIENSKCNLVFFCGSGSNLDQIVTLFDALILLEVSDVVLEKRLIERKVNEFGKTPEIRNFLFSELKDDYESRIRQRGAISVNTELGIDETVRQILASSV